MQTKSLALLAARILKVTAIAGVALVNGSGCASSSGSGGPAAGGQADCASICQRIAALNCPNDQPGACENSCSQPLVASCAAQTNAAYSCLGTAPLQCGADGKAGTSSCGQQTADLGTCVVKALFSGDGGFSFGDAGFSFGDAGTVQSCVGSTCPKDDLSGTPECEAFCTKLRTACGPTTSCDESFWCKIRRVSAKPRPAPVSLARPPTREGRSCAPPAVGPSLVASARPRPLCVRMADDHDRIAPTFARIGCDRHPGDHRRGVERTGEKHARRGRRRAARAQDRGS